MDQWVVHSRCRTNQLLVSGCYLSQTMCDHPLSDRHEAVCLAAASYPLGSHPASRSLALVRALSMVSLGLELPANSPFGNLLM